MVSLALYVFALNDAKSYFPSKRTSSILDTSIDGVCTGLPPKFATSCNASRSDSDDVPCGRLLLGKFTVQTCSAPNVLTISSPLAHVALACSSSSLVVQALDTVLEVARLPPGIQASSAVSGEQILQISSLLRSKPSMKLDLDKQSLCLTVGILQAHPTKTG